MASNFRYRLTKQAEADLEEIVFYLSVELSNPQAATGFVDQLQRTIKEMQCFPESGAQVINEFLPRKGVRKKIVGSYVLYYLSDQEAQTLYVLRIVYGRRSMEEILRSLD